MDTDKTRTISEKFLPHAPATLAGAQSKMLFLADSTEIQLGVPMQHQIHSILRSSQAGGLTVKEVSQKLCLNTKTCAKVLDEMAYKYRDIQVTAHRYGRVFVHQYKVVPEAPKPEEVPCPPPSSVRIAGLESISASHRQRVEEVFSVSCCNGRRSTNRQRLTQQTFTRALYILKTVQERRVISVNELKDSLSSHLEPNAQWRLDRKTVIRILSKLARAKLVKQLCFRVQFDRCGGAYAVEYIGDSFECPQPEECSDPEKFFIYKKIVTIPGLTEHDSSVQEYHMLANPTKRKPITIDKQSSHASVERLKNKQLRRLVCKGSEEGPLPLEALRADRYSYLAQWVPQVLERLLYSRYYSFLDLITVSATSISLKNLLVQPSATLDHFAPSNIQKLQLSYHSLFPPAQPPGESPVPPAAQTPSIFSIPRKRPKRKAGILETGHYIKKLFLALENNPLPKALAGLKHLNKGIDVELEHLLQYLSVLGYVRSKQCKWVLLNYR